MSDELLNRKNIPRGPKGPSPTPFSWTNSGQALIFLRTGKSRALFIKST